MNLPLSQGDPGPGFDRVNREIWLGAADVARNQHGQLLNAGGASAKPAMRAPSPPEPAERHSSNPSVLLNATPRRHTDTMANLTPRLDLWCGCVFGLRDCAFTYTVFCNRTTGSIESGRSAAQERQMTRRPGGQNWRSSCLRVENHDK